MGEVIKFEDYIDCCDLEKIKINFKIIEYNQLLQKKNSKKYYELIDRINNYISCNSLANLFYKIRQSDEMCKQLNLDSYVYDSNEIYRNELLNGLISLNYLSDLLKQNNDINTVASLYIAVEHEIDYLKTLNQFYVQYLRDTKAENYDGSDKTKQTENKLFLISLGTDYLANIVNDTIKQKRKNYTKREK